MNDLEAIERAARLEQMGIAIKSPELQAVAKNLTEFRQSGGNRAMRRAAKRSMRRRGR